MSFNFTPGDRVWVFKDTKQEWWPARVLSREELTGLGHSWESNCNIAVGLYSGEEVRKGGEGLPPTMEVLQLHTSRGRVLFFETSSEKAVTSNSFLKQAMANALSDPTANPLKSDQELLTMESQVATSASKSKSTAASSSTATPHSSSAGPTGTTSRSHPSKRRREGEEGSEMAGGVDGGSKYAAAQGYTAERMHTPHLLSTDVLKELANALERENELVVVRRLLTQLDRVEVPQRQLEESGIGVAVGNLLGKEVFRPIWPLAKAMISFWARCLPKETLAGIQKIRNTVLAAAAALPPVPTATSGSPHFPFTASFPSAGARVATAAMYDASSPTVSRWDPPSDPSLHPPPSSPWFPHPPHGAIVEAVLGGGKSVAVHAATTPISTPTFLPSLVPASLPGLKGEGPLTGAGSPLPNSGVHQSFLMATSAFLGGVGGKGVGSSALPLGSPQDPYPSLPRKSVATSTTMPALGTSSSSTSSSRNTPSSPTHGSPFSSPNAPASRSLGFSHHVSMALESGSPSENAADPVAHSVAIERVTQELVKGVVLSEDRQVLLSRLRNPELPELREKLLSGEWDAATYLRQTEDVFTTQSEREAQRRRVEEALDAQQKAVLSTMNETSLFTCENCGKKRCRYYEQQTRGGDEPSTKFITCLECNITWTQE